MSFIVRVVKMHDQSCEHFETRMLDETFLENVYNRRTREFHEFVQIVNSALRRYFKDIHIHVEPLFLMNNNVVVFGELHFDLLI